MLYADMSAALSFEAFQANLNSLDSRIVSIRPHPGQIKIMERLLALLDGSSLMNNKNIKQIQDPLSFRCVAQIHGACHDMLDAARHTLEVELNSTTDSPAILSEDEIISNGNINPVGLAMSFDALAMAISQLVSTSTARVLRLNDPKLTSLPFQLASNPGLQTGLGILQKTIASLDSTVKHLANPSCLHFLSIANSLEDHATMATYAVAKLAEIIQLSQYVFAIEMLTATQAIALRGTKIRLGAGTSVIYAEIRKVIPFIHDDYVLSTPIEDLKALLENGLLLKSINKHFDLKKLTPRFVFYL